MCLSLHYLRWDLIYVIHIFHHLSRIVISHDPTLRRQPHTHACTHHTVQSMSYLKSGWMQQVTLSPFLSVSSCISVFVVRICFLPYVVFSHSLIVCTSAHWSASVCVFLWVCVCVCWCVWERACLSTCPVCFVSLQSADKDTVPAQLFSACLPPWRLQLQASTSSPLPHFTSPPVSPISLTVLLLNAHH